MDLLIVCPMCVQLNTNPRLLSCGDVYCLSCVSTLVKSGSACPEGCSVICPLCLESVVIPSADPRALPSCTPRPIMKVSEQSLGGMTTKAPLCQVESCTSEAAVKCEKGCGLLCAACEAEHSSSRISKHHRVVDVAPLPVALPRKDRGLCVTHGERVAYICRDCVLDPFKCATCKTTRGGCGSEHVLDNFEQVWPKILSDIKCGSALLEERMKQCKDSKGRMGSIQSTIQSQLSEINEKASKYYNIQKTNVGYLNNEIGLNESTTCLQVGQIRGALQESTMSREVDLATALNHLQTALDILSVVDTSQLSEYSEADLLKIHRFVWNSMQLDVTMPISLKSIIKSKICSAPTNENPPSLGDADNLIPKLFFWPQEPMLPRIHMHITHGFYPLYRMIRAGPGLCTEYPLPDLPERTRKLGGLTVDPKTGLILVCDMTANKVLRLQKSGDWVPIELPLPKSARPAFLSASPNRLAVSDVSDHRIYVFEEPANISDGNYAGGSAWTLKQTLGAGFLCHPQALAYDRRENLYVVDFDQQRVVTFCPDGNRQSVITLPSHELWPMGICINDDNRVIVSAVNLSTKAPTKETPALPSITISIFDEDGKLIKTTHLDGVGPSPVNLHTISRAPGNEILFTDSENNAVRFFKDDGSSSCVWNIPAPMLATFGLDNLLYVTTQGKSHVSSY